MAKQNSDNASWLRPLPEEFASKVMTTKRRLVFAGVTSFVLIGFGLLVWFSYTSSESEDTAIVPVIRADRGVVKEKPDEPGGKEIPFQDKEVFDRVDNLPKDKADMIASSAEIPLKRPMPETPAINEEEAVVAEASIPQPQNETVTIVPEAKTEVSAPLPPAMSVKTVVAETSTEGKFMIQIGAFADKGKAEGFWTTVKEKNINIMSKLSPNYMRVDLGEKGVLYRVRGGMLASRAAADDVCTSLKKNNQGCIVVAN